MRLGAIFSLTIVLFTSTAMSAALTVAHAREVCHTLDSQLKDMTNQVENLDATTPDVISGNLNVISDDLATLKDDILVAWSGIGNRRTCSPPYQIFTSANSVSLFNEGNEIAKSFIALFKALDRAYGRIITQGLRTNLSVKGLEADRLSIYKALVSLRREGAGHYATPHAFFTRMESWMQTKDVDRMNTQEREVIAELNITIRRWGRKLIN